MVRKIRWLIYLFVVCIVLFGNNKQSIAAQIEEFKDYYAVTFPAGSYFAVTSQQPIDSGVNKEDDLVEAVFTSSMYVEELLVIPEGSKVIGRIERLEQPHQGRNSLLTIRFLSVVGPNNAWETPIVASIVDKNSDGSIGGQLTDRTQLKAVVHNIERIGPYIQYLPSGPRAMGKQIFIPPGERWIIMLNQPARFVISK